MCVKACCGACSLCLMENCDICNMSDYTSMKSTQQAFIFVPTVFFCVQRITQPEFAMALSVLWWFKVMRMPVTKMGTKMAFKHGPEGAKIVCFGKCIFLTNKRHWCAGREKCLAKSGCCTSSPCRELTNSWPAIQWMQWSCHRSASTACDA